MFPPHLPPPAKNIAFHRRGQELKWLLAACIVGLVAGFAGAAVLLGWVLPRYAEPEFGAVTLRGRTAGRPELAGEFAQGFRRQVVTFYRASKTVGAVALFTQAEKIGDALVVSSDGWVVLAAPLGEPAGEWVALLPHGRTVRVVETLADPLAGVWYVKISVPTSSPEGPLRVAKFVSESPSSDVFTWHASQTSPTTLAGRFIPPQSAAHLDSAYAIRLKTAIDPPPGSFLLTPQAEVLGLALADGSVLPATAVANQLPSLLTREELRYQTLGIEGWFTDEAAVTVAGIERSGFLVGRVRPGTARFMRGDLITKLNGEVVSPEGWWYTLKNEDTVRVTVLRRGQELTWEIHPSVVIFSP